VKLQWLVLKENPAFRTGIGFDAHCLRRGRRLVLGGVVVPSVVGAVGHSDADVLLHALTDAILGATASPDIGTLFPDNDPKLAGADSAGFLAHALQRARRAGYCLSSVDCVVVCDRPRLTAHTAAIRKSLARLLRIPGTCVGLKAKTTEGTRLAEPGKSIAAVATVLLERK